MYANTNKHESSRRDARWAVITIGSPAESRHVARKRGGIPGAELALIGEHVFGPPSVKASPKSS